MIPEYLLPVANHLWQSTLFAAAAGLLTLAFRKNRATVRYGLWLAASVKFLIPFSLLVGIGSQLEWRTVPAPTTTQFSTLMQGISQPFLPPVRVNRMAVARASKSPVPVILLSVWFWGFLTNALSWIRRWRQIRSALRAALPLHLNIPIRVMSSPARLEPGAFGILRPVLLLPDGITDRLTPGQLDAVLAHELCHVRRRDNLGAAIHMFVEALFWFHPLVWWIEHRLVEERERACDEEVLRAAADPEVYAEGLLSVCKFYLESPLACVSGVTGSNLRKRIEEIMTDRVAHNLNFGKKLLLTTAGVAAVAVPILIGIGNAPQVRAQSQAEKHLAFEVASVKLNKSEDPRSFGQMKSEPGGRLTVRGTPLYLIIADAYDVSFQSPRLSGGPDWIRSERYDIVATAEKGAIPVDLPAKEQAARTRLMLQALLAERFKLTIHRESKELPVYSLTVGKNGPKLQKSKTEEKDCADPNDTEAKGPPCHRLGGGMGRGLHGTAVNMADVVRFVENWTDRPLIDKTGLEGLFDIETEGWSPMRQRPSPPPGTAPSAEDLRFADPTTPTLYMIFERLGLKMESQKAPIETYVIERVERPTEN